MFKKIRVQVRFGFGYFKKSEFGFGSASGSVQFMNFPENIFIMTIHMGTIGPPGSCGISGEGGLWYTEASKKL